MVRASRIDDERQRAWRPRDADGACNRQRSTRVSTCRHYWRRVWRAHGGPRLAACPGTGDVNRPAQLPSVSASALSGRDRGAVARRHRLRRSAPSCDDSATSLQVLLGKVTGIDIGDKAVLIDGRRVAFDQLIIATGARHGYFNHEEWEKWAPGLKKIDDATEIRGRILLAFERAESTNDESERQRLLSFVIVGGGPTGVEMAGAIAELARVALSIDFRNIDPKSARVILVESGSRVLAHFPESPVCGRETRAREARGRGTPWVSRQPLRSGGSCHRQ